MYIKLSVPNIFVLHLLWFGYYFYLYNASIRSFQWDKSVIKISPSKFMGLSIGESSCRAATLLHLDLHGNFLGYHPSEEMSSLLLLSSICISVCYTYCQVASDTDTASFHHPKWNGCLLHMLFRMCWILSQITMPLYLLRSSPMALGTEPKQALTGRSGNSCV
jgi:hypothetical protein